jgi:hypothetical protein
MLKFFKKRLKKFHLIDVFGIGLFFLILAVAAIFFLRKSSYTYVTLQISKGDEAYHNFWFYKPTDWYIQNLKLGMTDKSLLGKENLKLVDIHYYPVLNVGEQTVFVTLKVNAVFNKQSQQYSHQGKPLLIGDHRIFQIGNVSIPGLIRDIGDDVGEVKTKKVIVKGVLENEDNEYIKNTAETRFFGIKNYLANKLEKDTGVVDSNGSVIAKILKIEKSPGYREFIYGKSLIRVTDPDRKIVNMETELVLTEVNGKYLFREENVMSLGSKLLLSFEDFDVYITVEEIEYL